MKISLGARHDFLHKYGVPEGWTALEIRDLAEVVGGATPSRDESRYWNSGQIAWATPTDLTSNNSKYISETAECISEIGLASCAATILPVGSVLYTSRATIGAKAIARVPIATNQGFASFIPNNVDGEYLYYLLDLLTPTIKRLGAGTTFDEVSRRDIRKLWCAIPPLEEQTAIARILDTVDKAIELTSKAVEFARVLDHSLLNHLLECGLTVGSGQKPKRPAHWQIKRVDEVAEVGSGVTLGRDVSGSKYVELPYLRVANVQDGHLDLSVIKTVKVRIEEVDRYRLEAGDVLMTEGGDLDKLGRGTLWEGQIPDCLHQNHIFRIRANRAVLNPRFFAYVVESDITKGYFLRVAKRTTNLASTNKTQVRAFRFPVPPLREQERIVEIISTAKAQLRGLMRKKEAFRRLKQALMRDLLTGKVRVNHLNLAAVASS